MAGLLFSCFTTIICGNALSDIIPPMDASLRPAICNSISVGYSGEISKLPLGQSVISFTFGYLLYTIIKNNIIKQNIATIVFFPILLLFDLVWNAKNGCYSVFQLIASLIIGGAFGMFWSYIIAKTKNPDLQYFAGVTNNEVCSAPSKQTFKCRVFKNGQLISKM
jgi:large-conductance mechanosensitive channel